MITLLRMLVGGALAWCVGSGIVAPETPVVADAVALIVVALTAWRPTYGLAAVVLGASAGVLFAPVPARESELLAWAFVATSLLRQPWHRHEPIAREVATPALLFAACAFASWLGITIGSAAGIEPRALPLLLAHTVGADHLLFSSAEPETSTLLQVLAGLALFLAAGRVARADVSARRTIAWAIVASGVVLALATQADVLRQWAREDYGSWFLWRYVRGERFSLHLTDVNAAGSQYVLAGLAAAALAVADRARRALWVGAIVIMAPALWLTGSRSAALGAILVGATVIPVARHRVRAGVARAGAVLLLVFAIALMGATIVTATQPAEQGTATSALKLRSAFLVTSARMFASAPVYGVGIGHYHERSAEFMPPSLREVYAFENAHNYFAQQFAELGVIGGLLFVWLVIAAVRAGWNALGESGGTDAGLLGLVAGSVGYLLTCVTGHPLLVSEAALPFWAAFGVMASAAVTQRVNAADAVAQRVSAGGVAQRFSAADIATPIIVVIVLLVLAVGVGLQARRYARTTTPPTERGFHELETGADGVRFNWMSPHGVFYVGAQPGFLVIPVRAPQLPRPRPRPFIVEVDVGGRHMGSYEVFPDRWTDIRIGLREPTRAPFRRVDLRVAQWWSRKRDLGSPVDDATRTVMVGAVQWQPAGSR